MDLSRVSRKIKKLVHEGRPVKQAAAIAFKYGRSRKLGPRGGLKKNPTLAHKTVENVAKAFHGTAEVIDSDFMEIRFTNPGDAANFLEAIDELNYIKDVGVLKMNDHFFLFITLDKELMKNPRLKE